MSIQPKPEKPKKSALVDLHLGPLPVEAINRTLGHDLEPGDVIFTAAAQAHVIKRHADDYARCIPHVGHAVTNPTFMGDDFKNPGIELVARIPAFGGILVAVGVELDPAGFYRVHSMYPVSEQTIENRRQKRRLTAPKRK